MPASLLQLPLTPLHISTELQHPQHAALGPHAAHHPSLFTAAGPQPHPHAGPPQLYSGPPPPQQQVPQAGGPPSAQGAAAGANESVEQQQIRLHKHLLMLLKNGSLKTTMEGIEAQYVLSESAPQAEDGGNRIASPWVLKSHLIQVIAQLLGEPINHPMLAKTLSDFKPGERISLSLSCNRCLLCCVLCVAGKVLWASGVLCARTSHMSHVRMRSDGVV